MTNETGEPAVPDLRSRLAGQNFHERVRASAPAGIRLRTPEEMERTLEDILAGHDSRQDLHVFGYGSLMWNPGFEHTASLKAKLFGWRRRFCIRSLVGRGAPETPGLMLALDRGGSCSGMLFRIGAEKVRSELNFLWRREMTWGSYEARWVKARVGPATYDALTFVVDRTQERYLQQLPAEEAARLIATGSGQLGTCRSYFDATLHKLRGMGIRDGTMEELHDLLVLRDSRAGVAGHAPGVS